MHMFLRLNDIHCFISDQVLADYRLPAGGSKQHILPGLFFIFKSFQGYNQLKQSGL